MNKTVAALALALCASTTMAQTAPTAKPAAAKAAPKATAKKAPPVEAPLPAAEGEQTAAAAMVHFGDYGCEFNQTVTVAMNPKYDAYIDVMFGKQRFTMKPVLSSTGALRLEDVKGQAMMLQIAYKSMLMDVKAGRRLVDECVHEKQLEAKRNADGQPREALLTGGAPTVKN
ncbi:hypothetical protein [Ideonella margarita]|uniref:Uncharacterized protein n=1 Tax=Ideonella margarita TaxID=2984191 RepID=A0ABU9CBH5_9BURK